MKNKCGEIEVTKGSNESNPHDDLIKMANKIASQIKRGTNRFFMPVMVYRKMFGKPYDFTLTQKRWDERKIKRNLREILNETNINK